MHFSVWRFISLSAIALLCSSFLLSAAPSTAQSLREIDRSLSGEQNDGDVWTTTGLYVGGIFALTSAEDTSLISSDGATPAQPVDFDFDDGVGGYGFIGWDYGTLRSELEVGIRSLEISGVQINNVLTAGDGDLIELSGMFNLYLDIPITNKIEAFVGGGVGGAFLYSEISVPGFDDSESDDFVFAYQAMAGLQFEVMPRFYLLTGYRIHSFEDPNFDGNEYDAPLIHSIDFGLRYVF